MPTLEWIGKNKVVNHHQEVPFRVLERQYSFDEQGQHTENNDSENMIIHGDNLEALKALLPQYEGKVKCIYIVILTPILMSILSSENAVRLNFIIHIMFLALFEMRNYNVLCGGAKWTSIRKTDDPLDLWGLLSDQTNGFCNAETFRIAGKVIIKGHAVKFQESVPGRAFHQADDFFLVQTGAIAQNAV